MKACPKTSMDDHGQHLRIPRLKRSKGPEAPVPLGDASMVELIGDVKPADLR
jgi:hypothetical protein